MSNSGSAKLEARAVEKPWGRTIIPACFGDTLGRQIGEVWFEHGAVDDLPLLVKYIFTSENLSIQVHPDDEQAQERGFVRGKTECWYVLDADPGACLGLGLRFPMTASALHSAALDGSIEQLIDWRPVSAGEFYFVPPGTIHAIGAGITLLEIQQNSDIAYRLYDYGRPRELHLTDGIAVSKFGTYAGCNGRAGGRPANSVLLSSPAFSLVRANSAEGIVSALNDRLRWVVPLTGSAEAGGHVAGAGECLLVAPRDRMSLSDVATVLIGVAGPI